MENLGTEKGDLAAAKDALAARVEALAAANGELEANVFALGTKTPNWRPPTTRWRLKTRT